MKNASAKFGPWKLYRKDVSTYKPLIVEQYEREGLHDIGEFSDMPTWEKRIVVIDENGSKHEFSGLQQQKQSDDFIKQKMKELKKKKGNAMTNSFGKKIDMKDKGVLWFVNYGTNESHLTETKMFRKEDEAKQFVKTLEGKKWRIVRQDETTDKIIAKNSTKNNAAPVKSPSANKVASGTYRGADWYMWKDGEKFVGQLVIELGKTKERKYMAESGSTQEQALQKLKQRADKTIEDWNKKWPNDTYKNSLEAKKLAVIKSNAAPEVKLKALEKLNATLTLKRGGGDELLELSPEAQKAMKERFKTAQPSSDKMVLREAVKRMFKQGKKLSEIEKALKIKIDYDGVAPAKDIPAGQFEIK